MNNASSTVKVEAISVSVQTAATFCLKQWLCRRRAVVALSVGISNLSIVITQSANPLFPAQLDPDEATAAIHAAFKQLKLRQRWLRLATRLLPLTDFCISNISIRIVGPGGVAVALISATGQFAKASWRSPDSARGSIASPQLLLDLCSQTPAKITFPFTHDSLGSQCCVSISRITGAVDISQLLQPLLHPGVPTALPAARSAAVELAILDCDSLRVDNAAAMIDCLLAAAVGGSPATDDAGTSKASDVSPAVKRLLEMLHKQLSEFHSLSVHATIRNVVIDGVARGLEAVPALLQHLATMVPDAAAVWEQLRIERASLHCSSLALHASIASEGEDLFKSSCHARLDSLMLRCNDTSAFSVTRGSFSVEPTICISALADSASSPLSPSLVSSHWAPPRLLRASSAVERAIRQSLLVVRADFPVVDIVMSNAASGICVWLVDCITRNQHHSIVREATRSIQPPSSVLKPKFYVSVTTLNVHLCARDNVELAIVTIKSVNVLPTKVRALAHAGSGLPRTAMSPAHLHHQHVVRAGMLSLSLSSSLGLTHVCAADGVQHVLPRLLPHQSSEVLSIHNIVIVVIPKSVSQSASSPSGRLSRAVTRLMPVLDVSIDTLVLNWSSRFAHSIGVLVSDTLLRTEPISRLLEARPTDVDAASSPCIGILGREDSHSAFGTTPTLPVDPRTVPFHTQRQIPCFVSPCAGPHVRPACETSSKQPPPPRTFDAVFGERLSGHLASPLRNLRFPRVSSGNADVFESADGHASVDAFISRRASGNIGPSMDDDSRLSWAHSSTYGASRGIGGVINSVKVKLWLEHCTVPPC